MNITHLGPNYTQYWSKASIERRFEIKFKGPGLYLTKTDTLMVVPNPIYAPITNESIWTKDQSDGKLYMCDVYNAPFENTILSVLAKAPTRVDER